MKLQAKYRQLKKNQNQALLATNYYNLETLTGILRAASDLDKPIILQLTESSLEYMGLKTAVKLGRAALEEFKVKGWIQLDHGGSIELMQKCLDEGFDSVMIDASEQSLVDNIAVTKATVKIAEPYHANVEAELGYVAKLGQNTDHLANTEPDDAKRFVEETGVHALAVAIGTSHGFYKQEPDLDLDRLSAINQVTDAALVLHGCSGVPHHLLIECIKRGICKINLATEIKSIFMQQLKADLAATSEIDLRKVFPNAIRTVTDLVGKKLKVVSFIET
jgi:tagatose 1,6-diphosphate aldolase GatY/KbaY